MAVDKGTSATKAASPREFFADLAARAPDTKLRAISGSCRFDIQGAGSWIIALTEGKVAVRDGAAVAKADATMTCSVDDFMRIARGELNLVAAGLQGRVQVTGSMALLQLLQKRLFL
jgi:putative sterol carrier protein